MFPGRRRALTFALAATTVLVLSSLAASASAAPMLGHGHAPKGLVQGLVLIEPSGAVDPSTAPISVSGNVYSLTSSFYGSIVDERNGSTVDGAGFTVNDTPGQGAGLSTTNTWGVSVEDLYVENASYGVWANIASGLTVTHDGLNASRYGVSVLSSSGVHLTNNNLSGYAGIAVNYTAGVWVGRNNLSVAPSALYGFFGMEDDDLNLSGNYLGGSQSGAYDADGSNVTVFDNTGPWSPDANGIDVFDVEGPVRIVGNDLPGRSAGVFVDGDTDVVVSGNDLAYAEYPIDGSDLVGASFSADDLFQSGYAGALITSSRDLMLHDLNATSSSAYGVDLRAVGFISISDLNASRSAYDGIFSQDSDNVTLADSNLGLSAEYGAYLEDSRNTTITGTNLSYAVDYGIYSDQDGNDLYENDQATHVLGEDAVYLDDDDVVAFEHDNLSFSELGIYNADSVDVSVANTSLSYEEGDGFEDVYGTNLHFADDNASYDASGIGLNAFEYAGSPRSPLGLAVPRSFCECLDLGSVEVLGSQFLHDGIGASVESVQAQVQGSNFSYDLAYGLETDEVDRLSVSDSTFFNDSYAEYSTGWEDEDSYEVASSGLSFHDDTNGLSGEYEIDETASDSNYVNCTWGIYLDYVAGTATVEGNTFHADEYPVEEYYDTIASALSNNITGTWASGPALLGIDVEDNGASGTLADNEVIGSSMDAIYLVDDVQLLVSSNDLKGSSRDAIWTETVGESTFVGNDLAYSRHGLSLNNTTASTFEGNTFVGNGWEFTSNDSFDNTFFHNDFVADGGYTFWGPYTPDWFNATLPTGGNFWSNYTGKGGGNGIGTTPQPVAGSLQDYLPLVTTWAQYTLTFVETGLPAGTLWSVSLDGVTESTTASSLFFTQTTGAVTPYGYTLGTVTGYVPSVAAGTGSWDSTDQLVQIAFVPFTYLATFQEVGLPTGTVWTVSSGTQSPSEPTSFLNLSLPNGTHAWSVGPIAGYVASPASGNLVVNGAPPAVVVIRFSPFLLPVIFSETGLPAGVVWGVSVNGGSEVLTNGTSETFQLANGTVAYSVPAVAGFTISSGSGTLTVAGTAVHQAIVFAVRTVVTPTFAISFAATGLPNGTSWGLAIGGERRVTDSDSLSFQLSNGSYAYAIIAPSGYVASPSGGNLNVTGAVLSESIAFSPAPSGTSSSGQLQFFAGAGLGLSLSLLFAIVVCIFGWVLYLRTRRHRTVTVAKEQPKKGSSDEEAPEPGEETPATREAPTIVITTQAPVVVSPPPSPPPAPPPAPPPEPSTPPAPTPPAPPIDDYKELDQVPAPPAPPLPES